MDKRKQNRVSSAKKLSGPIIKKYNINKSVDFKKDKFNPNLSSFNFSHKGNNVIRSDDKFLNKFLKLNTNNKNKNNKENIKSKENNRYNFCNQIFYNKIINNQNRNIIKLPNAINRSLPFIQKKNLINPIVPFKINNNNINLNQSAENKNFLNKFINNKNFIINNKNHNNNNNK